jgi:hypothetical protein
MTTTPKPQWLAESKPATAIPVYQTFLDENAPDEPIPVSSLNPLPVVVIGGGGGGGGDASAANQSLQLAQETAINTALGLQNDAAAASDTGTYSIIAFIKRGMQNWTTLLSRLPAALTAGGFFKVSVQESAAPLKVTTETPSSQPGNTSQITLLAANAARLNYSIFNESYFATLYLAHGASVSTSSYKTRIPPQSYWSPVGESVYTGQIVGLWHCPEKQGHSFGTAKISQGT